MPNEYSSMVVIRFDNFFDNGNAKCPSLGTTDLDFGNFKVNVSSDLQSMKIFLNKWLIL